MFAVEGAFALSLARVASRVNFQLVGGKPLAVICRAHGGLSAARQGTCSIRLNRASASATQLPVALALPFASRTTVASTENVRSRLGHFFSFGAQLAVGGQGRGEGQGVGWGWESVG